MWHCAGHVAGSMWLAGVAWLAGSLIGDQRSTSVAEGRADQGGGQRQRPDEEAAWRRLAAKASVVKVAARATTGRVVGKRREIGREGTWHQKTNAGGTQGSPMLGDGEGSDASKEDSDDQDDDTEEQEAGRDGGNPDTKEGDRDGNDDEDEEDEDEEDEDELGAVHHSREDTKSIDPSSLPR
ncbi:uncharacterized protein LOC131079169 [Cryptomeria japonica]|uniref:uncharacterized protein LOC131079169 n=1 Tax=Cryptomeria japonica TaxID=3369 RepID=UPI0025AC8A5A|nr:uncharacterized protein LOC131079169 [Cryptomeria japonica]